MSIKRGSTPTHFFRTDISLVDAVELYVTYKQLKKTVVEKTKDDCVVESDKITVVLTQADTLKFNAKYKVEMQIRPIWADGSTYPSNIMVTDVYRLLKGGEIG